MNMHQIFTLAIQVQDCLSINTMAAQDRRRHREQHVVSVGVVDQLGEKERDVDDCLLVQERSSSQGWQLGWVTKKVAGASLSEKGAKTPLPLPLKGSL